MYRSEVIGKVKAGEKWTNRQSQTKNKMPIPVFHKGAITVIIKKKNNTIFFYRHAVQTSAKTPKLP